MPREFQDFSDEVAKGASNVKNRLEGVVTAAGKADDASARLGGTQSSGTAKAENYTRALGGVAASLRDVAGASGGTVAGMTAVTRSTEGAEDALTSVADVLAKTIAGAMAGFEQEKPKRFAFMDALEEGIDEAKGRLALLEDSKDKAAKGGFLDLSVNLGGQEAIVEFVENMDDAKKATFEKKVADEGLDTAVQSLIASHSSLAAKIIRAKEAAAEAATASDKMTGEISEASSAVDLLKMRFQEGQKEAEGFASSLGKNGGVMMGAGVAAAFLLTKLADLVGQFQTAATELATFSVNMHHTEAAMGLMPHALDDMRTRLSLTREQSGEFFKVLQDGANSGVISISEMVGAAENLRTVFGGDQTERLRGYVELLKEIPSLETDLSITASLDEQAAGWFALAKEGKVESVIELQAAGLMGGVELEATDDQAKLLNVAQSQEKLTQDIKDTALGIYSQFPVLSSGLSMVGDIGFKTLAAVGGVIAAMGAFKLFSAATDAKKIASQYGTTVAVARVEAAVRLQGAQKLLGSKGPKGSVFGRGVLQAPKRAMLKVFGPRFSKPVFSAAGKVGSLGKTALTAVTGMSKLAKGLSIAGIAALGVEWGLGALADNFEESGNKVAASATKTVAGFVGAAGVIAGFAALGSIIPGVGTAIGALAGAAIVAVTSYQDVGASIHDFGASLQETEGGVPKFNSLIRLAGKGIQFYGESVEIAGAAMGGFASGLWEGTKNVLYVTNGFWLAGKAIDAFRGWMIDDRFKEAQKLNAEASDRVAEQFALTEAASKNLREAMLNQQKGMQVSALALQKALAGTAAVANTGKAQLAEFNREVAEATLEMVSGIGGTVQQFDRAIGGASAAVKSKFKVLSDGFAEQRVRIIKNEDTNGIMRAQALRDLHKEEMKAAKELVDGISAIVESMMNSPRILEAGLKDELAGVKFDFQIEAGTLGAGQLDEAFLGRLDNLWAQGADLATQSVKAHGKATEAAVELQKAQDSFKKMVEADTGLKEKLGGVVDESGGIDIEAAQEKIEGVNKAIASLTAGVAEEDKKMKALGSGAGFNLGDTTAKLTALSSKLKTDGKKLADAQKEYGEAVAATAKVDSDSGKSFKEKKEDEEAKGVALENYQKVLDETKKAHSESKEKLVKVLTDRGLAEEDANVLYQRLVNGKEVTVQNEEAINRGLKVAEKISAAQVPLLKKRAQLLGDISKQENVKGLLEPLIESKTTEVRTLQDRVNIEKRVLENYEEVVKVIDQIGNIELKQLQAQRRNLSIMEARRSLAQLGAGSMGAVLEASKAQLGILEAVEASAGEILNKIQGAKNKAKDQLDAQNKRIELLEGLKKKKVKKGGDLTKGQQEELDSKKREAAKFEAEIAKMTDAEISQRQKMAEAAESFAESITNFGDRIVEEAMKGLEGRGISKQEELAEALMDSADVAENMGARVNEAFGVMAKASEARLKIAKKAAEGELVTVKASINKRIQARKEIDDLLAGGKITEKQHGTLTGKSAEDKMAAAELLDVLAVTEKITKEQAKTMKGGTFTAAEGQQAKQTAEAEKRTKLAKEETDQKRKVLDFAKRAREAAEKDIDLQMEALEAEADFLSEMGGSLSSFIDIQNQMVQLERNRLVLMEKELERAKATNKNGEKNQRIRELETGIIKQQFSIRKKELGVQKDIFEKIIGAAFGEVREAVGARKGRMTTTGLAGLERRVVTRAGVLAKAGPGGVKTIDERAAGRSGGVFGIGKGGDVPGGRLAEAPRRLDADKKMAEVRGGKADKEAWSKNKDEWLPLVTTDKEDAPGKKRDEEDAPGERVAKQEEAAKKAEGGRRAGAERAAHAVEMGAAAPGGGGAEMPALKIEGEMMVKFDNAMLKSQMVTVVGEAINTAEVRKALERAGFVNKKS